MTRPELAFRYGTADDLRRLEPLWVALYAHQTAHGMRLPVPTDAFAAWAKTMTPILGRFAVIALAERGGDLTGFVAGRVRTLPPYFGSATVGFISEVYVSDTERGSGIGRRVLGLAVDWFMARGVRRLELQVVSGSPEALRFYRGLGWHEELVQLVWDEVAEAGKSE